MNSLNTEVKNWYGDWEELSIDRLFQEEEVKESALTKLSYDIFAGLSRYLNPRDRKSLAMVCKPIYRQSLEVAIYREFNLIEKFVDFIVQNLNPQKYETELLEIKNLYDKLDVEKFRYRSEGTFFKETEFGIEEVREEIEYAKEIEVEIVKIRDVVFNLLGNVKHDELDRLKNLCTQEMPRFFEDLFDIARIRSLNVEKAQDGHFSNELPEVDGVWRGNFKVLYDLLQKHPFSKVLEIVETYFNGRKKDFAIYQLFYFRLNQVFSDLNDVHLDEMIKIIRHIPLYKMKTVCINHIFSALFLKSNYTGNFDTSHWFKLETEKVFYVIRSVFLDVNLIDRIFAELSFQCKLFGLFEKPEEFIACLAKAKEFALFITDELKRDAVLHGLEDNSISFFSEFIRKSDHSISWDNFSCYGFGEEGYPVEEIEGYPVEEISDSDIVHTEFLGEEDAH